KSERMSNMKKMFLLLFSWPVFLAAQEKMDLAQAYDLATKNYPAIREKDLLRQTASLQIDNLQKLWLPQVTLSAQGSYQSSVSKIDVSIPGFTFPQATLDQYKLLA